MNSSSSTSSGKERMNTVLSIGNFGCLSLQTGTVNSSPVTTLSNRPWPSLE